MAGLIDLANPTRFMRYSAVLLPWLAGAAALMLAVGFYLAWFEAPADYQQGETIRIMFVHVPAAWLALMFYSVMAVSALGTLVWRHPLADVAQKAAAPIGASFALICLLTGAFWGKPMWGTYWVWDARLTSVLVLLLIYLGILAVGFTCLALALHLVAMRAEIMRRRVRTLTILEAERLDQLAAQGLSRQGSPA